MKGSKVYYHLDKSLTGTVVGVTKPLEKDKYSRWWSGGRWHSRKRASAGTRLVMVQWDRPCNLYKWIRETSVVVIDPVAETKEQVKEPKTNKETAMKQDYYIAFTGHRPNKIGGYDATNPLRIAVRKAIKEALQRAIAKFGESHRIVVISGGALGVDQDAASVAHSLGLPFIVAVPCKGQDSKWPESSKKKYQTMLKYAERVVMVHDGPYNNTCMQDRNKWMVDNCHALVAVWDGTSGGTANCVKYARSVGKPIVMINPNNLNNEGV